jgi:hypothetical protein
VATVVCEIERPRSKLMSLLREKTENSQTFPHRGARGRAPQNPLPTAQDRASLTAIDAFYFSNASLFTLYPAATHSLASSTRAAPHTYATYEGPLRGAFFLSGA